MPKAKRSKVVSLSKTTKKGFQLKKDLVEHVQNCVDEYSTIYVFSVENMRTQKFKQIREKLRTSRFFMGKNKVMSIGLGKTAETEYKENLHKVTSYLSGNVGLMFTNESRDTITSWFESFKEPDFARAGNTATEEVTLPEGPLNSDIFPHMMEPELRRLGLPTVLKKGIINLERDHKVCKVGDTLSPEQCAILKKFSKQMVEFHIVLKCMWNTSGEFEHLSGVVPQAKDTSEKSSATQPDDNENIEDEGIDDEDDDDEDDDDVEE